MLLPVPLSSKSSLRGDCFVINLYVLELGEGGWGTYIQAGTNLLFFLISDCLIV